MTAAKLENPNVNKSISEGIVYCESAKLFLDAFAHAVRSVTLLHEQQFRTIVEGDPDAGRFDLLIHEALEQKQNAKYAYLHHLESHGCSNIK
jgi:hypothetical protein